MPTTPEYRAGLIEITRRAEAAIAAAYPTIQDGYAARAFLSEVLPDLVADYGSAAASLAADWYDDLRDAEGAAGRFVAVTASLPDREVTDVIAGVAVGPLFKAEPDHVSSLTLVQGGLQYLVANAARDTIVQSATADPGARGWRRLGVGENCGFCKEQIAGGAVYTESSARFRAHDHCNCYAAPAFRL
jgi:hypothetical protein